MTRRLFACAPVLAMAICSIVSAAGAGRASAAGERAVSGASRTERDTRRARNVILFVGDGMGIATVTAARILEGQNRGGSGEENLLPFEAFPQVAFSKTYSVDGQVADSAPTATALVTGVKTKDGLLSVDQDGVYGDHLTVAGNELPTILELAEDAGLATGIVTTTRVTHATPAACYAHTTGRDWESDSRLTPAARDADFPDIARQLLEFRHGDGPEVVLGGGRACFMPGTSDDPEDGGRKGNRGDGRDLTAEWTSRGEGHAYVWNREQFEALDARDARHLLGLFEREHMEFEADRARDTAGEPSLSEMTTKAIDVLSRNGKGFFLMVEGGRIDHGHHAGNAYRALTETIEFSNAVRVALGKTNPKETLIIVTADHSHSLTLSGYARRGNPILGLVAESGASGPAKDLLGLPYTTLRYSSGPGWTGASRQQPAGPKSYPHWPDSLTERAMTRPDLGAVDTASPSYLQESAIPLPSECHAGEDVPVYATGPGASLVHGVIEQNVVFHVMKAALFGK